MEHEKKCELIHKLSKDFKVISEIGSKDESLTIEDDKWVSYMKKELQAGSWKVIAEKLMGVY